MNIKIYDEDDKPCNRNAIQYDKSLATLTTSAPLSLIESRLVFSIVAQINIRDEDFKNYKINATELHNEIQNEIKSEAKKRSKLKNKIITANEIAKDKSKQLEIFCKTMMGKTLNLPVTNDLDFDIVGWFSNFHYKADEDNIYCNFHPKLKPYLIDFKNNHYKKVFASNILRFKSKYTHKLYLLLKTTPNTNQYIYIDRFKNEIPLTFVRELLGIEDDEYKLYADLKRFVLNKMIEDLKSIAEVYFEFEEIKKGKKVEKLKFKVIYVNKRDVDLRDERDESETRLYDEEVRRDTDLENQDIEYFINGRIIRFEDKNYKLIELTKDEKRNDKLSLKLRNVDSGTYLLIPFNYKSKEKLKKEFILPNYLNYKIWFDANATKYETGSLLDI